MRALVVVAAAVLLAGCTSTRFDITGTDWAKPGVQISQTTLDEMECARTAVDARPFPDTLVGGLADIVVVQIQDGKMSGDFARCMAGRGYQAKG